MAGAITPLISYENPQGPLIRQAKAFVTRRLSNVIMARAGLYTYEEEKNLEIFLICEVFQEGLWKLVKNHFTYADNVNKLETYYAFQCEPNQFHRVRAFYMVNNRASRHVPTQRLLLSMTGVWNNWGRDDGLDEPRVTPLDLFYDGVPLPPIEERKYFPDDSRDDWNRTRK